MVKVNRLLRCMFRTILCLSRVGPIGPSSRVDGRARVRSARSVRNLAASRVFHVGGERSYLMRPPPRQQDRSTG